MKTLRDKAKKLADRIRKRELSRKEIEDTVNKAISVASEVSSLIVQVREKPGPLTIAAIGVKTYHTYKKVFPKKIKEVVYPPAPYTVGTYILTRYQPYNKWLIEFLLRSEILQEDLEAKEKAHFCHPNWLGLTPYKGVLGGQEIAFWKSSAQDGGSLGPYLFEENEEAKGIQDPDEEAEDFYDQDAEIASFHTDSYDDDDDDDDGFSSVASLGQVLRKSEESEKIEEESKEARLLRLREKAANDFSIALQDLIWSKLGSRLALAKDGYVVDPIDHFLPSERAKDIWRRLEKFIQRGFTRSVIFYGPPGSGKSHLMRCIASAAGGRTLRISAEGLSSYDLPTITGAIRLLNPDCVIIDDLDRLGNTRLEKTLTALEQIKTNAKMLLASVNRVAGLDPAIIRPGRFDDAIEIKSLDLQIIDKLIGEEVPEEVREQLRKIPICYLDDFRIRREVLGIEEALAEIGDLLIRANMLDKSTWEFRGQERPKVEIVSRRGSLPVEGLSVEWDDDKEMGGEDLSLTAMTSMMVLDK